MGRKEKLISKLKTNPKDFYFEELESLLRYCSYRRSDKGKTSGSRVLFVSEKHRAILIHKPHPDNLLKAYQVKQIVELLTKEGLI